MPKETEVPEEQLVSIFKRVERYLLPLEAVQRLEADDEVRAAGGRAQPPGRMVVTPCLPPAAPAPRPPQHDDDDQARDMNMSELKKLQASFSLLAEEQRRYMDTLSSKLDSLGELQQQTGNKLDYVDGQVRKIVPHFADE